MEFKAFPKIERIGKLHMVITQKIHGSNAQIVITETDTGDFEVLVGSRNRWIKVGDDNYGFAAYVEANKNEIIMKLGVGTHFGEWAGLGINSGEGLTEKTFVLFDHWKFPEDRPLPPGMKVVPVLYSGGADLQAIETTMLNLKTNGSKLVPGFMRPEGVVVKLGDVRYKKVFDAEETEWKKADEKYRAAKEAQKQGPDLSYLLHPIRLEKLLSKDERYLIGYPDTLSTIANDYFQDLVDEGQVEGPPDEIIGIKRVFGKQLYPFIKEVIKEKTGL